MATKPRARKLAVKPLNGGDLESKTVFEKNGREYDLREPEGQPSGSGQLWMLWNKGMLVIVEPGTGQEFTKGEASWALDQA